MVREPYDRPEGQFSLCITVQCESTFAREHHDWQLRHRRSIIFTDDGSFTESNNDRRARVWIRQRELYADWNIVDVDRYDGGSSCSGPICP